MGYPMRLARSAVICQSTGTCPGRSTALRAQLHARIGEGPCGSWDGAKPLTLTLSPRERGPKKSLESPLPCLQWWDAQFAGDLRKPLDDLFVEWDAVLSPLPFFLVFQEAGIEYPLLSCRCLGLQQPLDHLVHLPFKLVTVRKRPDTVR